MVSRTRILCLHEGESGSSIDPVFIRGLIKALDPSWVRPWEGNNVFRAVPCGGRSTLIDRLPEELKICREIGSSTTVMVWADLDHDMADGPALKEKFWRVAKTQGISRAEFEAVVFVFAKDRLENWIEFLNHGSTDETREGRRIKYPKEAAVAAKKLAELCRSNAGTDGFPTSLTWSCRQWRELVARMR